MEDQPAASGVGSPVDPDLTCKDEPKPSDSMEGSYVFSPQLGSQSETVPRKDQGPVDHEAKEMTEDYGQNWPHKKLADVLDELKDLMPPKDFGNVQSMVESCRNQTPDFQDSLFDLLHYLKDNHRKPEKGRKKSAVAPALSSTSNWSIHIVKVYPEVTGKTFGADEVILEQAKKTGMRSTTTVEITTDLQDCDIMILFCPIISRVGTDVDRAMRNIPEDKKVILVLMHHTRHADYSADEKKNWSEDFKNVVLHVHVFYHETLHGLVKCKRNEEAIKQIRDEFKKHSKIRTGYF